jgi:glycosyltransferase involved in cell wall biosynthesis
VSAATPLERPLRIISVIEGRSVTGPIKPLLAFARRARLGFAGHAVVRQLLVTTVRSGGAVENAFIAAARSQAVPMAVLSERHAFDRSIVEGLVRVLERERPDMIESHGFKAHVMVCLARRRIGSAAVNCPWVAFHHGYTTESLKVRLYNQFDRFTLRHADRVITFCQQFARSLATRGVRPERLSILRNALDPSPPPTAESLDMLRAELGIAPSEVVLLAVGRLSSEKGHAELIDAFAQLLRRSGRQDLRLMIVGDGIDADRLKARAKPLGSRVIFAGQRPSAWPFFALADIFVLPSRSEGSPLVLLEAMQARLPIVATSVGAVPDTVQNGISALLVPPRDPAALAAAVTRLLADTPLAARLAERALHAVQGFTADDYAAALLSIYQDVVRHARPLEPHA